MGRKYPPVEKRFWAKVDMPSQWGACWLWNKPNSNGYGLLSVNSKLIPAHRISYELAYGSISFGQEVDHLCRIRHCINPLHLEAVTPKENRLRSLSP